MKHSGCPRDYKTDLAGTSGEPGISAVLEYLNATAVLIVMFILLTMVTGAVLIEEPSVKMKHDNFVDIGNGVSTRIVDIYVIAPENGRIVTYLDLPDTIAADGYIVEMDPAVSGASQRIIVTDGNTESTISIAGIGATRAVYGSTTGSGLNRIIYDSEGV